MQGKKIMKAKSIIIGGLILAGLGFITGNISA